MAADTHAHSPLAGHFHAVRFYSDARDLCTIVGQFIIEGLQSHQPAVVIATPPHRDALLAYLCSRGIAVADVLQSRRLILHDGEDTLAQFLVDGMPDPAKFRRTIVPIIEGARGDSLGCTVRAYGEMVNVLWHTGHTAAAIRLETLWNDLARTHEFSLLCGYAIGNFYKNTDIEQIRGQHSHVITGAAAPTVPIPPVA